MALPARVASSGSEICAWRSGTDRGALRAILAAVPQPFEQLGAFNLSPVQFRTTGFAERIIAIIRNRGADPHRIELEVTEGLLLDDNQTVSERSGACV